MEDTIESLRGDIRRLNNTIEFMGRKLGFMIPKIRVDEQIQLDEFEIGAVITWHRKMLEKCQREHLTDRADYHNTRIGHLMNVVPAKEDNDVA